MLKKFNNKKKNKVKMLIDGGEPTKWDLFLNLGEYLVFVAIPAIIAGLILVEFLYPFAKNLPLGGITTRFSIWIILD
ncbi:MAG: hypothetical protein K2F55_04530, partial [Erysipelotrichaceae bacterium]|nr:hypothetical protein [Erysipelotrichaceae bacterium]